MERDQVAALERAQVGVLPVRFEAIPEQIACLDQWVVWRFDLEGGRLKKPPFDAKTLMRADITSPARLSSLSQARSAYEAGGFDGIGLVLIDGLVGIDIDHCIHGPIMHPKLVRIMRYLGTYFELSPSGRGLHGLTFAHLPGPFNRHGRIEMYESQRYITITGHHIDLSPSNISTDADAFTTYYHRVFATPSSHLSSLRVYTNRLSDIDDIIHKARDATNGANFDRYFSGDASLWVGERARHTSKSEADFTLCLMLSYWTHGDASLMDTIFRRSALFDAKWDRSTGASTYGQKTIDKALFIANLP